MQLTSLAAKQKRCRDIRLFVQESVRSPHLQAQVLSCLARYQQALAEVWRAQGITPESLVKITSIERELEALHNEARLLAQPPASTR